MRVKLNTFGGVLDRIDESNCDVRVFSAVSSYRTTIFAKRESMKSGLHFAS
jgi:hypothetical protein